MRPVAVEGKELVRALARQGGPERFAPQKLVGSIASANFFSLSPKNLGLQIYFSRLPPIPLHPPDSHQQSLASSPLNSFRSGSPDRKVAKMSKEDIKVLGMPVSLFPRRLRFSRSVNKTIVPELVHHHHPNRNHQLAPTIRARSIGDALSCVCVVVDGAPKLGSR